MGIWNPVETAMSIKVKDRTFYKDYGLKWDISRDIYTGKYTVVLLNDLIDFHTQDDVEFSDIQGVIDLLAGEYLMKKEKLSGR